MVLVTGLELVSISLIIPTFICKYTSIYRPATSYLDRKQSKTNHENYNDTINLEAKSGNTHIYLCVYKHIHTH